MTQIKIKYFGDLCPLNQKFLSRRFVLSGRYRDAKDALMWAAKGSVGQKILGNHELKMTIETMYPRAHDIDAFIKFILDALQSAGTYENDSQITELKVIKRRSKLPGAVITIERMDES